jgi:RNA 2',3'-cyclic 3'-phosphodiesterase
MRVFIAIDLTDEVRIQLAEVIKYLRRTDIRASWVRAENLHITMKFLGDINDEIVPDLCRILDRIGKKESCFKVNLKGTGFFPQRGQPRILYAAIDQQQKFVKLIDQLDRELVPGGFDPEKNFVSHITLARIKGVRHISRLYDGLEEISLTTSFRCSGLSLYRSILLPSGVRYEQLYSSLFQRY